ncbi:hypothetical protein D3C76_893590 [compost metagenome]
MWPIAQAVSVEQSQDLLFHRLALAAVDHAEQVESPVGKSARASIAEGDGRLPSKRLADGVDPIVVDVQYQHGVGRESQRAMVDHQADAPEQPGIAPPLNLLQYLYLMGADLFRQVPVRSPRQRQPLLEKMAQVS